MRLAPLVIIWAIHSFFIAVVLNMTDLSLFSEIFEVLKAFPRGLQLEKR